MTNFEKYVIEHKEKLYKQKWDYYKLIVSVTLALIIVMNYDNLISFVNYAETMLGYYKKGYLKW